MVSSIHRITDALKVGQAFECLTETTNYPDPIEWVANKTNIVYEDRDGNIALFEYAFPDKTIYSGHYYFKARGRKAIEAAKGFLDTLFNSCYNIQVLTGFVPIQRKAARWITRQIGFTSYGIEEVHGKEYEMFILTKKEFYK